MEARHTPLIDDDFDELEYGAADLEPISLAERRARVKRLAGLMEDASLTEGTAAGAFLCEPGTTLRYLTGVGGGRSERLFGLVVLASGELLWIAPSFEVERMKRLVAEGPGGEILGWDEHEYAYAPLAAALAERGVETLAVEPELRHVFVHGMGVAMGRDKVLWGGALRQALRGTKDTHELALLRRANELTVRAFNAVEPRVEPGVTARQVAAMITTAQTKLGLESIWNLTLVGPNSAEPHGGTDDTPLAKGDVILIDTGGSLFGYQSDNTRTWVVGGEVPDEVAKVWDVVRAAQMAAFEQIKPGNPCFQVDAAARKVVTDAGFGDGYLHFTHRLGHGIGMDGHEAPYFDGGDPTIMVPGMTFSNEPGIYQRGKFGVRLENIVAVTEDGAECFGGWQAGPSSPR
ncbi:M24 family metallopeptidase [Engelhardtia mirabilis]|uniref:Xaa-Pro dipeptidase n=1 Tax=Engelhardtia mirabilis TaxID=2528011 RepID=A0A518BR72_9BACT|nr:Xaa-Pro dipeptidase [Planctomycetes bacterium Pla133]QDV03801.1 Xaa-Pro dipeptidase [Planctomycetes bacterium Pla86]